MSRDRIPPLALGRRRAGRTLLTRRRLFSKASDMALGLYAASTSLTAGCTQAAPITAAPTPAAALSGGRAPFQIMALKDYAVPPDLQALRMPDAKDEPLSGAYGQPHILARSLIEFATDGYLLYDRDATPPWSPPDVDALEAFLYRAAQNIRGPDFNGILFINGEGPGWHRVDGEADNAWRAVDTPEGVDRAVAVCVAWVEALRQVCPRALMAWYAKPAGAEYNWHLGYLQEIGLRQAPLLEALDILSPSLYVWYRAYPDGFDRAVADFRDKLAWIRDTYSHRLLCPTIWEEFYLGNSGHDRSAGQSCPVDTEGRHGWATVPTYNGASGQPTCAQPSFSRAQWDSLLDMIYSVGCDGVFYWATPNSWGKYFTDPDEPGIRGLLDLAERLNGATPRGDGTATFGMDRGPFAS
jgi:hypothetical protein